MKTILSVLLGIVLLTSLVSLSYATPLVQPTQNSGDINACVNLKPNNPNYYALDCAGAAHQSGNENPPPHHCVDGKIGTDASCCPVSISPHSIEVSDIHPDLPCR